jgi:hypothetical protein
MFTERQFDAYTMNPSTTIARGRTPVLPVGPLSGQNISSLLT